MTPMKSTRIRLSVVATTSSTLFSSTWLDNISDLVNIDPLRDLENLESLILTKLGIADLGRLEGKKLRILALVNLPKLKDLSKLINLPQIDFLILINTGIEDFSVLEETNIKNILEKSNPRN